MSIRQESVTAQLKAEREMRRARSDKQSAHKQMVEMQHELEESRAVQRRQTEGMEETQRQQRAQQSEREAADHELQRTHHAEQEHLERKLRDSESEVLEIFNALKTTKVVRLPLGSIMRPTDVSLIHRAPLILQHAMIELRALLELWIAQ